MLSPGDGPVVYRADQDTDGVRELYRVRLGGGENVKLNPPLPPGWEVRPPGELGSDCPATIAPDSRRILFETAAGANTRFYSAPSTGASGAAVRIDNAPATGPSASVEYKFSADSQNVVFTLALPSTTRLISTPIAGPADAGRRSARLRTASSSSCSAATAGACSTCSTTPCSPPDGGRHAGADQRRGGPDRHHARGHDPPRLSGRGSGCAPGSSARPPDGSAPSVAT